MELFEYSWLKLFPPLIAVLLAVVTRKVLFSLTIGIFSGAIILQQGVSLGIFDYVGRTFLHIFYENGQIKTENTCLMIFLWFLGIVIQLMQQSGGIFSFSQQIAQRVVGRVKVQLLVILMGIVVFIDDFFNSLVVGAISRSLVDKVGVSRAKLAYILDSTAGPVCIIAPISSWGASIIVILNDVITRYKIPHLSGFTLFIQSIPYNLYAIFTLIILILVVMINFDFPRMRKQEKEAKINLQNESLTPPKDLKNQAGSIAAIIPTITLTIGSIASLFITGLISSDTTDISFLGALENAQIGPSLLIGGTLGILSCLPFEIKRNKSSRSVVTAASEGFISMYPAMIILCFAWALSSTISDLKTGEYLAHLVTYAGIPLYFLPAFIFLACAVTSFSTGTSWATFAMFLPIVCEVATTSNQLDMLFPLIGAVLGGAVFGDHSSPISDTSILSSSGAGCPHMEHVLTQMPYCLMAGFITFLGYLLTSLMGLGLTLTTAGSLAIIMASRYYFSAVGEE